jgi:hypothetical protein
MSLTLQQFQSRLADNSKETSKIKTVVDWGDCYNIGLERSWAFCLKKQYCVTSRNPVEGDEITLYCKGTLIRGVDLNGEALYYKTDEQLEEERIEWLKKHAEEKLQKFIENRHNLDQQYESLPYVFKCRINKLRNNNPYFRIEYEGYEMMCCTQAVSMANTFKTDEKLREFANAEWKEQKKMFPDLDDGHSGNSLGMSVILARTYISDEPDNVIEVYGCLAPLVGSDEYGDNDKLKKEKVKKFAEEFGDNSPYNY